MSEDKRININSDDEDDLESLRLAALKSINSKKDSSPNKNHLHGIGNLNLHLQIDNTSLINNQETVYPNMSHINQQHNHLVLQSYGNNSESNGIRPNAHQVYYPQVKTYPQPPIGHMGVYIPPTSSYISSSHQRPIVNLAAPMVNNIPRPPGPIRPWIPPEQTLNNGNIYSANKEVAAYTPKPIIKDTHLGEVQLSPRSLAFVAQNNGILARRKIEADLSPKKHYRRSKSPNYRRISRSPSPVYRSSPGRWSSISPPPHSLRPQRFSKSKSKSPFRRSRSKAFQYNYKRSRSRSLSDSNHLRHTNERRRRSFSRTSDYRPPLSPNHHNRHLSRSPPANKNINVIKRNKSRSPLQRRYSPASNLPLRRLSRSRSPRRNYFEHRRSRSPQVAKRRISPSNTNKRNQRRPMERKSPVRNKKKSPVARDVNRRVSPLSSNNFNRRLRKSLSPQQRKRSRSPRSPINISNKKIIRKSRDRQTSTITSNSQTQYTSTNAKKMSPIVNTFKNRNNEIHNGNNNTNIRNKIDSEVRKSSKSPNRKCRSKSRTADKILKKDEILRKENEIINNRDNEKKKFIQQKAMEEQSNKMNNPIGKIKETTSEKFSQKFVKEPCKNKDEESKTPPQSEDNFEPLTPPIDKDTMDNAKLLEEIDAMLGENKSTKSNSSDDDEDDGIDLFASEESESENEGRFKSSNKTERNDNIQAMSFTKLKESSTTSNVRNLQDVVNDEKYDHNLGKSRRDYFKKYRNNKSDNRRHDDDYSSSKRRSRSCSIEKTKFSDSNNDNINKSKFKSTFQIIKNEGSRILSKPSLKNNLRSTPERNVKKRSKDNNSSELKDRKPTSENMNTPPHLLEQLRTNQSYGKNNGKGHGNGHKVKGTSKSSISKGTSGSSHSSSSGSRKSIHSRLGAMTNTFKAATKSSWSINSSYKDQV